MKKIKYLVIFLLMIPILVFAANFDDVKDKANSYSGRFAYSERYLVPETSYWDLDNSFKPKSIGFFRKGGFITQKEMAVTSKGKDISFSYMYDGTKFWAIDGSVVGGNGSNVKTKITEYVAHDTKVTGIGTYANPFMFVDSYEVTVKSNGGGKIDNGSFSTKPAVAHRSVSFVLTPDSGFKYYNHNCGASVTVENNILTFNSVEKNMSCEVTFGESKDSFGLPTPCFEYDTATSGHQERCFSAPVPNQFYYRYGLGYYSNEQLTIRVGKLTQRPVLTGWTFQGYFVGDKQLVKGNNESNENKKGTFDDTYTIINEGNKDIKARGVANTYTIVFEKEGGTGGTGSKTVQFDHDLPIIEVPVRPGYVFAGYFTGKNGEGTQYYGSDGSRLELWHEAASTSLYANWTICPVGSYCPGDNTLIPCPSGLSTETTGSISCKQCRYYDSCLYNTLECHYGCDCYDYSYQCCSQYYYNSQFRGCLVYGTCNDTYCSNCSNCKYTTGSCTGGYVYNNSCEDGVKYNVNFDKQEGTGGSNGYTVTYYGDSPSIASTTIETPTRAGYVFDGYYTAVKGGGTKIINAKTTTEGFIAESDIRSILPSATPPYTLYANWIECEAGNYCPGDNTTKPCEPGKYQNQKHQASCIPCIKKSNQGMYGATSCEACNSGLTNTVDGKSVCDTECSNKANVKEWEIAVWNSNNTVTNACKIKSCADGYRIESNKCVRNKVYIRFKVASGDKLTPSTSNSDGSYTWTTDSDGIIYKNGEILQHSINYGGSLGENGLVNYNNTGYLNITKDGYRGVSGAEWVKTNDSSKKYNQNTQYNASDFCNNKTSDCVVTLKVNWEAANTTVTYTIAGGNTCTSTSDCSNVLSKSSNISMSINSNKNVVTLTLPTSGDWQIEFYKSGVFKADRSLNVDLHAVGGGGSGASGGGGTNEASHWRAGGGGGGYVKTATSKPLAVQDYIVTVGDGGTSPGYHLGGNQGGTSSFGSLVTAPGGYGGTTCDGSQDYCHKTNPTSGNGGDGGSGGGASGLSWNDNWSYKAGGNGGSDGSNGSTNTSHLAGAGQDSLSDYPHTTRDFGESTGTLRAGGGGGRGGYQAEGGAYLTAGGTGGEGGGGNGATSNSTGTGTNSCTPPTPGADTFGGGGGAGGGNNDACKYGAAGGSGIVIIRNKR